MIPITAQTIQVDSLRPDAREPIQHFASRLMQDFGTCIQSFCVVGSVLTADYHPRHSDINSVLVLDCIDLTVLQTLAGYAGDLGKRKIHAPYLMTEEYVRKSHDVFGVEFLDFQLNHAVVLGNDPFKEMTFGKECVRLQCERELRSAQIQLWEGYIRSLGDRKTLEPMLTACVKKMIPIMRAILWMVGRDRPMESEPTLRAAADYFRFDAGLIETMLLLRRHDQSPDPRKINNSFMEVFNVVDRLCRAVDQMGGVAG